MERELQLDDEPNRWRWMELMREVFQTALAPAPLFEAVLEAVASGTVGLAEEPRRRRRQMAQLVDVMRHWLGKGA